MLFHEIYGCYYHTVAKLLTEAVNGELTSESMNRIVRENAFSESVLTIIPSLKNEDWHLMDKHLHTPLQHKPTMPLTTLQKQWLKAISLDPRIALFRVSVDGLDDVVPLFTPHDFVIFDQYNDGDPFDQALYIQHFHTILDALHKKQQLHIRYKNRKGTVCQIRCFPKKLEYSEKDDKFRLFTSGYHFGKIVNLARIESCELLDNYDQQYMPDTPQQKSCFIAELTDKRNTLERTLLHFAHFEKQAEKVSDDCYKITVWYDRDDETELIIRVLSFGAHIKVIEPDTFIQKIKERLLLQKSCGLC